MEELSAFAPIVLFAYNRPEHTRQLLESLNRNPEAAESDLIVFCDGPKEGASAEMLERIKQVRETVRNTAHKKEKHNLEIRKKGHKILAYASLRTRPVTPEVWKSPR